MYYDNEYKVGYNENTQVKYKYLMTVFKGTRA